MKRMTGAMVLEVRDSNPNGDPDRDSYPRIREDGRGEISPVSVKRKLRDLVDEKEGPVWKEFSNEFAPEENHILESRRRDRSQIFKELEGNGEVFIRKYWDARLFGCTFLENSKKSDAISRTQTGVVQIGMGVSTAPINVKELTFTNKAGVEGDKDRGMAPLGFKVVEHAVYTIPFFVNPSAAPKTNCTERDIDLFLKLMPFIYSHTRSMIRSQVEIVAIHTFTHNNALGSISDLKFIDAVTPKRKGELIPSSSLNDYELPEFSAVEKEFKERGIYKNFIV